MDSKGGDGSAHEHEGRGPSRHKPGCRPAGLGLTLF